MLRGAPCHWRFGSGVLQRWMVELALLLVVCVLAVAWNCLCTPARYRRRNDATVTLQNPRGEVTGRGIKRGDMTVYYLRCANPLFGI